MAAKSFLSLLPSALDLVERSMNWMDTHWDADAHLLYMKSYERLSPLPMVHHIRETSWYALGLLLRASSTDKERACSALQALLKYQFDEPGAPYDGTWYRFPEEPHPGTKPIWRGYDPNWREFIGTILAIILIEYEQDLPASLVKGIDEALRKAIRGALARNMPATYTNIALMHAFLLLFAGERLDEPAWIVAGEQCAQEIHRLFAEHAAFSEFNSPTYYGVDLYALGLWRTYSSSVLLHTLGIEMEKALWRDIALMYHAELKNMSGPYDRSYGMDLQKYVTTLGMWLWIAIGKQNAPFPDVSTTFEHEQDFCFAPAYVAVGVQIPEDVLHHFLAFQGERQVERVISTLPRRVATAWIGKEVLLGGEYTSYSIPASNQFHPATIHWKSTNNEIAWIRLPYTQPINAWAEKDKLFISCIRQEDPEALLNFIFRVSVPGLSSLAAHIQQDTWQLPGLHISLETNTQYQNAIYVEDHFELCYSAQEIEPGTEVLFSFWVTGPLS